MLIITTTLFRPNTDVLPFIASEEFRNYMATTYEATGKLSYPADTKTVSEDGLKISRVAHWRSVADNVEYLNDPVADAMKEERTAYCTANLIRIEITRQIINDELDPA